MKFDYILDPIKSECLVVDIETCSVDGYGNVIDINSRIDDYVQNAEVKWFGAYSYKYDKLFLIDVIKDRESVLKLMCDHEVIIGFNSEEFDFPILTINQLIDQSAYYTQVDCMQVLGNSNFKNKSGYSYKKRGEYMKYKFKNNSLKEIAREMKLEFQKDEIDYNIFAKNEWTPNEEEQIKKYLASDVMVTKGMFDKLWDFWLPFTELLTPKYVRDLSWIKNSIASLTYKAACTAMGVEPTYSDKHSAKEEMGGRVLMPKYEEMNDVWYVDYASLYPHIFCMFNLFAENTNETPHGWHGNELFKVKGYYYDFEPHVLNTYVQNKLKERIELRKTDPNNPMIYALKIYMNSLYGAIRSSIFEKIHTPNAGYDCCWLGQQINAYTEKRLIDMGFEVLYGDTDSAMVVIKDKSKSNREYVKQCLNTIVKEIMDNVPFPVETFKIDIEHHLEYIMFPFSKQEVIDLEIRQKLNKDSIEGYEEREIDKKKCIVEIESGKVVKKGRSWVKAFMGKKKNYLYITKDDEGNDKIKLKGLPIIKSNATELGMKIYNEVLKPKILETKKAKFTKEFIENTLNEYLKMDGILELISREFKVKPYKSYANPDSQLQAQISKEYFNNGNGVIRLIKNNKVGKVGKGSVYCTIEEAKENKLTAKDLDLDKIWQELDPFIITKKEK